MSRPVLVFVEDDDAAPVEKVLRTMSDLVGNACVADTLAEMADATRDGINIEHDLHVATTVHDNGGALRVYESDPMLRGPLGVLREQLGADMEVTRVTIIVEGRAKS